MNSTATADALQISAVAAAKYVAKGVGRLFYIVSPQETTFAHYKQVPDYIAEAIPFFVLTIALEFLTLAIKDGGKGLRKLRLWDAGRLSVNDVVGSIGAGMLQQLSKFFIYNMSLNSYLYVYNHFRLADLDPTKLWVWVAGFLAVDLGYYLFHRGAHEINLFWAAHVVHHSSEYYNQTTALRQSILQPYTSWIFDLPSALFLPPSLYVMHKQFNTLFQYWIHTQVVGSLGPLEYIINTPSAHRVHHGRNPYCIDKNYAGTLIIWDILFGTFELERTSLLGKTQAEPVAFGLTHPINTFDPFTIQFHHLSHVLKTCWSTQGFRNRLKVLFYGPGWHDDTPRTGLLEEIPPIAKDTPPRKYDPSVSLGINVYAVFHFAVLVVVNGMVLDYSPGQLDFFVVLAATAYIFATLTVFGWIFDLKPYAIESEFIRSVLVCGAIELAQYKSILPRQMAIFQVLQFVSSLWLLLTQRKQQGNLSNCKTE
ncbi:fatty acid hydroxylase superfamily-domain-containing protein [Parasitella parasitica]|nr:fatty acid hydroxylase superfamily-domain-containing protein [Parasitella parasitica]